MPLFTNKDTDAGKPKFLVTDSNAPVGTRKSDVFGVDATDSNNEIRLGMVDRSWDYDVGSQPGNGGFSWLQNQATTMASNFLQNNFQNARFNAHYQMYRATDPKCSFYTAPGYGENFNVIEANTGYIDDQFATDLMPDPSLDKNQLPNKVPGMPVMQKISSTAADNYILSLKWQNNSGWRGYFDADMLGSCKRNGCHLGNLFLKLVPDNTILSENLSKSSNIDIKSSISPEVIS